MLVSRFTASYSSLSIGCSSSRRKVNSDSSLDRCSRCSLLVSGIRRISSAAGMMPICRTKVSKKLNKPAKYVLCFSATLHKHGCVFLVAERKRLHIRCSLYVGVETGDQDLVQHSTRTGSALDSGLSSLAIEWAYVRCSAGKKQIGNSGEIRWRSSESECERPVNRAMHLLDRFGAVLTIFRHRNSKNQVNTIQETIQNTKYSFATNAKHLYRSFVDLDFGQTRSAINRMFEGYSRTSSALLAR